MNFKELTLASFAAALALSTGCVVDDDPAGDTDDTDNPTTMTVTETQTGPTTDPTTTGPTTTDPDTTDTDPTTDTDSDTDGDTDTDTDDIDPDLYEFRDDAPDAYTQVDRQGFPAVNTALIAEANKDAYNAASPTNDAAGDFLTDVGGALTFLHNGNGVGNGLGDELRVALGALNPDATPGEIEGLICNPPGDIDPNDTCVAQGGPFIFPDVVLLNTGMPSGFPNGRALDVPVVDIILAVLLLDVLDGGKAFNFPVLQAFVDLDADTDGQQGLSQSGNDVEFAAGFPYLAPAHE
ncbi:MAG: hypothetical protein ACRBN8_12020 [Nannocystales bacterium]